ncbi:GFA family protein [Sinorhizobium sp. BG8]|nr:GFA family protein [Sinorhizobium sp. BG8]
MCQKAFGAYYAPLVSTRGAELEWTRGKPKTFRSSNHAFRGFCGECGTPLTYEAADGVALAAGAFDDPSQLVPVAAFGIEAKVDFVDGLRKLPGYRTEEDAQEAPFVLDVVSYQHPDHDTAEWPPGEGE